MKFDELRSQIKTGDFLLVDGEGFVSDAIEAVTHGRFSHIGVFFWENGVLKVAEEWQGIGYHDLPASELLPQFEGKLYLGIAPAIVRDNSQGILSCINMYRNTPALQPYGYITLAKVAAADNLGIEIKPDSVQAVCSVFAQRCVEACGIAFKTLMSPSDFDAFVAGTVDIEL